MASTSVAEKHTHQWNRRGKFTTINAGHRHRVDKKRRFALPAKQGGHKHILLGKG